MKTRRGDAENTEQPSAATNESQPQITQIDADEKIRENNNVLLRLISVFRLRHLRHLRTHFRRSFAVGEEIQIHESRGGMR